MTDATEPTTPASASERLAELRANSAWGAKLLSGDADTHAEFVKLTTLAVSSPTAPAEGSAEQLAAASSAAASDSNFNSFIEAARGQFPVSDKLADEIATLPPVSKAEKDLGAQWMTQLKNDPEAAKKLLSGDPEMKRKLLGASILANSDIRQEA